MVVVVIDGVVLIGMMQGFLLLVDWIVDKVNVFMLVWLCWVLSNMWLFVLMVGIWYVVVLMLFFEQLVFGFDVLFVMIGGEMLMFDVYLCVIYIDGFIVLQCGWVVYECYFDGFWFDQLYVWVLMM